MWKTRLLPPHVRTLELRCRSILNTLKWPVFQPWSSGTKRSAWNEYSRPSGNFWGEPRLVTVVNLEKLREIFCRSRPLWSSSSASLCWAWKTERNSMQRNFQNWNCRFWPTVEFRIFWDGSRNYICGSDQMKKAQKKLTLSKIDFLSSVIIIGLD